MENRIDAKRFFTSRWGMVATAVLCTLLWGSAVPCVKLGYELFQVAGEDTASTLLFAGSRFATAGAAVLLVDSLVHRRPALPAQGCWWDVIRLGVVLTALQYLFFYMGLSHTTGVKCSIVTSANTFLSVLVAHFFSVGDRLSVRKLMGCVVGFAGVVLINTAGGPIGAFNLRGDGFILMAALMFAAGQLLNKKLAQQCSASIATGGHLFIGGSILLVLGWVMGGQLHPVGWQAWLMLAYLILISSVSFTLWSRLLQYNPVSKVLIFFFLNPIFGVLLSGALLGEAFLSWQCVAALALVCGGIYIVNR
ncbi:MAG: DMT family transporter [Eubacteriales bacterium]|jgi:drug/metabolite transporter (DMT)-like permease